MEIKRTYEPTADGYTVTHDYGKKGTAKDTVHVPPHDEMAAANNRRALNAVLARYGYRLREEQSREEAAGK